MISHRKSTRNNVPTRYLLGELSASQREEFEEHFFECAECAEEVRALLAISCGAEKVLARIPSRNSPANARDTENLSWFRIFHVWQPRTVYTTAAVFALLAWSGISTHESFALRRQLAAQSVAAFSLHPDTRGEETLIGVNGTASFFILAVDVPDAGHDLTWQIRGLDSKVALLAGTAPAPPSGSPLTLLIPASNFKSGRYDLSIRQNNLSPTLPTEIVYRFRMH